MAAELRFLRALMVVIGQLWSAFDGPGTAQTAQTAQMRYGATARLRWDG